MTGTHKAELQKPIPLDMKTLTGGHSPHVYTASLKAMNDVLKKFIEITGLPPKLINFVYRGVKFSLEELIKYVRP